MLAVGYATGIMSDQTSGDRQSEIASLGGKARAKALSADERSDIASHAATARWNQELPKAAHSGEFEIGATRFAFAVLETGKRLWTAIDGIGSSTAVDDMLAAGNLRSFISRELREFTTPIFFRNETGIHGAGYDVSLLPLMSNVYLQLRDHFLAEQKAIPGEQAHIIALWAMLAEEVARAGSIVALVDKAAGAKDELKKLLEGSVAEELRPWIRRFPDEFFLQLYRLQDRELKPGSSPSPADVAQFIYKYIFEMLPDDVFSKLRESSPMIEKRYRRQRRMKSLIAYTGNRYLDQQISIVTTLLRIARNQAEFQDLFNRAFVNEGRHDSLLRNPAET